MLSHDSPKLLHVQAHVYRKIFRHFKTFQIETYSLKLSNMSPSKEQNSKSHVPHPPARHDVVTAGASEEGLGAGLVMEVPDLQGPVVTSGHLRRGRRQGYIYTVHATVF